MKNLIFLTLIFLGLTFNPYAPPSCDKIIDSAVSIVGEQSGSATLSSSEIVEGLKTALRVGTDSSVSTTSKLNGFYKDEAIKILLPPEAKVLYENKDHALLKATGLDKKIEEAVLALNRAAEDAASEAGPIFKNAILYMSITDGLSILKGKNPASPSATSTFDSTAATAYLKSTTLAQLENAFSPVVNASLDKKLVSNYSPNQIWNTLTSNYNSVARSSFGVLKPVQNTDLGKYVTQKALDGLFLKVAKEEIKIRRDPLAWAKTSVGNILKKVFGQQPD
jgi:hypothetical protein